MILKCKCKHSEQDKLHGNNMRVHNKTLSGKSREDVYRCSVCGNERTAEKLK